MDKADYLWIRSNSGHLKKLYVITKVTSYIRLTDRYSSDNIVKDLPDMIEIIYKLRYQKKPYHKLPQYYKVAKVHALISWMETTGLSSLEAGVMGCNLVITDKGDTKDYFSDYVYYCEPNSIGSIREAVIKAHENSVNPKLRKHILRNYIWENTAVKTLEAYKKISK